MKSLGKFPDRFGLEIEEQPAALRRAGAAVGEQREVLDRLGDRVEGLPTIVFTGMGSSYDACYVPVTVLGEAGIAAVMVDAAELVHFRRPILDRHSLLIAVSQSGESAEVVRLVESEWPAGRPTVLSVTNGVENPLARSADLALDTMAGTELGPSTMTFAASLVLLAAVAQVLGGAGTGPADQDERSARDADGAARAVEALVTVAPDLAARARSWLGARGSLVLLGRGTARAAAEMGALLMKEVVRFPAEALEGGQFRHGPLELAGPDLAVAMVATEPATHDLDVRLATELVGVGAAVLFVGPSEGAPSGAEVVAVEDVDRTLAPAVAMVPLQLLARRLAIEEGRDPGALTVASKVTTRE